ncbi:M23 family metallopeptidase [Capnocytophaga cynodegmi]|uniref:M23 family metallopeptidase n=1 Tax=Capnocytophaga cynodegmi TaxID=28189 RepID=UPI00385F07F9
MVCKHKNEWSYDVDKIKQDTKAYFEKIKNHFKQEYEPQKGKTEAENENLSKHLDKLLESVLLKAKGLYFWDEQFAKKTGLPADGVVWHFEPFAWVEQMKRVFSVCPDDCSQCVDYQDVVTTPRLNNQSNNVNKNRFRRVKRYNATYPYPKGYYHTGTDILAPSGEEVCAMLCGEVYSVVNTFKPNEYKANSLGNYLVIKSKDKEERVVYLQYSHLDEVLVKKGQKIKHGEVIGKAGSTGNAASVYNEKGVLIHGIYPEYRHIHIEAFFRFFF